MNILKTIGLLLLIVAGTLTQCMEKDLSVPINRFPAYFYFLGLGPGYKTLSAYTFDTLKDLCQHSFSGDPQAHINFCATLYILERTLLQKDIQEWTIDDLNKVNALLVTNTKDVPTEWIPGTFRQEAILAPINDTHFLVIQPLIKKIHESLVGRDLRTVDEQFFAQRLSAEDFADFKKTFNIYAAAANIQPLLVEFLSNLKSLDLRTRVSSPKHVYYLAAFIHYWLTEVHPWEDGNGKTARILCALSLMKKGLPPLYMYQNEKIYMRCVKNIETLTDFFYNTALQNSKQELTPLDLNNEDIHNSLNEESFLWDFYHSFTMETPDSTKKLALMKSYALSQLKLNAKKCAHCTNKPLQLNTCGTCHLVYYCSRECQRNDWRQHNLICSHKAKKQ